jgi:polyhydroxybutyrate depolymerase
MEAKTGDRRTPVLMGVRLAVALTSIVGAACSMGGSVATSAKAGSEAAAELSSGCAHSSHPGTIHPGRKQTMALDAGTVSGSYELSVPRTYRPRHPTPLILLFYGFDSDPAQFSALTDLPARGAKAGYLVAVPHTQAGESEWQFSGHGTDAAFVNRLVGSLEQTYCVDRSAIFAAGFSAGAAFTIAYSCAHQNQITAITTVAVEFQLGCTKPMPILAFHGTEDPLVPYQNGAIGLSLPGIKVRGTELNMGDWARLDHCRSRSLSLRIGSQVERQQWPGCADGASVVLYTIIGGGHSWPGADPKGAIGLTTEQVSATTEALAFFSRYSR